MFAALDYYNGNLYRVPGLREKDGMRPDPGKTTALECNPSSQKAPNCVRCTAFDANSLDFEVVVCTDATGASEFDVHRANLIDMAAIGVENLPTDDIIARLPDSLGKGLATRRPPHAKGSPQLIHLDGAASTLDSISL